MVEARAASTVLERRLRAEWGLLGRLAELNPGRLGEVRAEDLTVRLTLRGTPGLVLSRGEKDAMPLIVHEHALRIDFPEYFPAAPMEVYLGRPAAHPNVHPDTGFVCVWDKHRVSNTVEHAVHKTVAILGWRLRNAEAIHVMQPKMLQEDGEAWARRLQASALTGVLPADSGRLPPEGPRRMRLS